MAKPLGQRGNQSWDVDYSTKPDERIDAWTSGPFGVSFDDLIFAEWIPKDTKLELTEIRKAIQKKTGGDEFRMGKLPPAEREVYYRHQEMRNEIKGIEANSERIANRSKELIEDIEKLQKEYPSDAFAFDLAIEDLEHTIEIAEENKEDDYYDVKELLRQDYDKMILKAAEESSRNLQIVGYEHTRKIELTDSEKAIRKFLDFENEGSWDRD